MIEAIIVALGVIFSFPTILFLIVGTGIGIIFGALPGLGGVVAVALLIPVTFGMGPENAMVLFGSTMGGVAFGGSISAILLNIPGTAPNAATILDGYPMSQQGKAGEALGISATASALGAIVGIFVFIAIIPISREIVLAFGAAEFFWLSIFGLTIIAVVSRGRVIKGLIAGGIGVLIGLIGFSGATGEYRYGFGTMYLWDGINLVVALIGIFAIAEIIHLVKKGGTIAQTDISQSHRNDVITGIKQVLSRPSLFFKSSAIGIFIGMVPGAGGTIANFVSYLHAVQTSDDPDSFGTGNVEGVIASEASNDAKDGGVLVPTVVFGLPGDATAAVLLGAFVLHGLQPGRQMLGEDLPILFMIVFALLIANILTSLTGLAFATKLAKITFIPANLFMAPILVICVVGAFSLRNNIFDVIIAITFGFIGYTMLVHNYSRIALVLGLILAPIAERAFLQSLMVSRGDYSIFFTRPISVFLIILTVISISLPIIRSIRMNK